LCHLPIPEFHQNNSPIFKRLGFPARHRNCLNYWLTPCLFIYSSRSRGALRRQRSAFRIGEEHSAISDPPIDNPQSATRNQPPDSCLLTPDSRVLALCAFSPQHSSPCTILAITHP
jgi:hypothetical protein